MATTSTTAAPPELPWSALLSGLHAPGVAPETVFLDAARALLAHLLDLDPWELPQLAPSGLSPDRARHAFDLAARLGPSLSMVDALCLFAGSVGEARERLWQHAPADQRSNGAVYTPDELVEQVLDRTLGPALAQAGTEPVCLLDPACGAGAFLVPALVRMLGCQACVEQDREARLLLVEDLLTSCLLGVDLDPVAVQTARLALVAQGAAFVLNAEQCPNPSIRLERGMLDRLLAAASRAVVQRDALDAIGEQRFDVVVGNPPYVDADQMSRDDRGRRDALRERFRSATGNWNLYCLFVERALDLTRPGGWHGFVVPNTLRAARYARTVRAMLARENTLLWLADYSRSMPFEAAVYPVAYAVRRRAPGNTALVEVQTARHDGDAHGTLPYQPFVALGHPWPVAHRPNVLGPALAAFEHLPTLECCASVTAAATVAEAYEMAAMLHEDGDGVAGIRFVNSGIIDPFVVRWGAKRMRYLKRSWQRPIIDEEALGAAIPRRHALARSPKIIVAGMALRIEAVLDLDGVLAPAKSTTVIRCDDPDQLCFLAGVLNSAVASAIIRVLFEGLMLRGGYLALGPPQLRDLPVPTFDPTKPQVDELVRVVRTISRGQLTEAPSARALERCSELAEALYGPEVSALLPPVGVSPSSTGLSSLS